MQHNNLPDAEELNTNDPAATQTNIEINANSQKIRSKTTADFIIKQEIRKSLYEKVKIIPVLNQHALYTQDNMKRVRGDKDTFYIFYNKSDKKFIALWLVENNKVQERTLPEDTMLKYIDLNVSTLPEAGLEIGHESAINKLMQLFECKKNSKDHGNFHHRIAIVNKKPLDSTNEKSTDEKSVNKKQSLKSSYNWYMKFEDIRLPTENFTEKERNKGHELLMVAFQEVIAQEICRVIMPAHPKTRLIPHEKKNSMYVVSKEIPGFKSLSSLSKLGEPINQKGFGSACVLKILVNESDFKLDNVCIDIKKNVINFDGDWSYTKLRLAITYAKGDRLIDGYNKKFSEMKFDITQEVLDKLPALPMDYSVWNWADLIKEGKRNPNSLLLNELNSSPESYKQFQDDANEAKLKISLLSNELIQDLIAVHYQILLDFCEKFKDFYDLKWIETKKNELLNETLVRKEALKTCALEQDSFKEFIEDDQAKKIVVDFAVELKSFTIIQKRHLNIDIDKMLELNYNVLSNTFSNNLV